MGLSFIDDFRDRVPTKPGRRYIIPEGGGAPFYATVQRADEPVETGTPLNKALFGQMQRELSPPTLLASQTAAGTFEFTVPAGVTKILVAMIGGGGGGAGSSSGTVSGGGSGVADLVEMNVTPGQVLDGVVGAGGAAYGGAGGATSFNGKAVEGGDGGKSGTGSVSGAFGGQGSSGTNTINSARTVPYGGMMFSEPNGSYAMGNTVSFRIFDRLSFYGIMPFCAAAGGGPKGGTPRTRDLPNGNLSSQYVVWDAGAPEKGTDPGCGGAGAASSIAANRVPAPGCDGGIFVYDFTGR